MQAPRRNGKSAAAFRTISEVADDLDVPPHVLRFWETKFNQVRPLKRGGGRRYYRPEDVALLERIRELLYREGYTIKGVQKLLRDGAVRMPTAGEAARAAHSTSPRKGGNPESAAARKAEADAANAADADVTAKSNGGANGASNGHASIEDSPSMDASATTAVSEAGGALSGEVALSKVLDELKAMKRLLSEARH